MPNPYMERARAAAEEYLALKLGDRRGCRVLENLDADVRAEILDECARAFLRFVAAEGVRDASEAYEEYEIGDGGHEWFMDRAAARERAAEEQP